MCVTYPFAKIGHSTWIHHSCELSRASASLISVGSSVLLDRSVSIEILESPHPSKPSLILEDGVKIQQNTTISARNHIHIQSNTICGQSVLIMDHAEELQDGPCGVNRKTVGGSILVEEGCWIANRAVIVSRDGELVIGRNSVIGANSVVTRSVPPYSIVLGNPGRVIKQYDPATGKWVLGKRP